MEPQKVTSQPIKRRSGCMKYFLISFLLLLLIGGGFFYWKYYFVFGEGVKSGSLNYAVKKGQVFKTYEGKLIQEGIGRGKTTGSIQSNEFEFSIENKRIFDSLAIHSGKHFDLHYKEFNGILPWRGNTKYVVDSIISMKEPVPSAF